MTANGLRSVSDDELKASILGRLDALTTRVEWVRVGADIAFADSILGLINAMSEAAALREFVADMRHELRRVRR